jgi:hypothetical protein
MMSMSDEGEVTVQLFSPMVTLGEAPKPAPARVSEVPPVVGKVVGLMEVTMGVGGVDSAWQSSEEFAPAAEVVKPAAH